ncbi:MAG: DUF4019 domain-containing protein [Candidatus Omnitrophica bacterium]|nr:DUF4019 domain-containing protein [Candidatus Omnitrophota bacterium]
MKRILQLVIIVAIILCGRCFAEDVLEMDNIASAEQQAQRTAALDAAQAWLETIDLVRYSQSWEMSSVLFQKAVNQEEWINILSVIRNPLGPINQRKRVFIENYTELPNAPDGEYIIIQYQTDFENRPGSFETVTMMREEDGAWKGAGYYIR